MMHLQNCLFMLQMERNQELASSFPGLNPCDHKHDYLTISGTQNYYMMFRKTDMHGKSQ